MIQGKRELGKLELVWSSNTGHDWEKIRQIVKELAKETNENRFTVLTMQLLEALDDHRIGDRVN